jgi:hypothetical protein
MTIRLGWWIFALAIAVRSFSAQLMALSKNALSWCSSWRRMCWTCRFRASFRFVVLIGFGWGAMLLLGGSGLPQEVEVNAM